MKTKKQEPVSLVAFKDLIDTCVEDGVYQATIAATAFIDGMMPEDFATAIRYAAEENVELVFVPDVHEHEQDYNPQDEDRRHFQAEQN